jgi:hypothetical protein
MEKARVGLIGLGFGSEFIPIYQAHPKTEVAAICQRTKSSLDEVGDRFGIAARYTDFRDVLADPNVDIQVYSVDGSPDGKAAIVDGTMTEDGVQVPIQEAEVAFKQALALLETGKMQAGSTDIPKKDLDYYTSQWGGNIDKATYLPSFLLTKEMSQKNAGKWQ